MNTEKSGIILLDQPFQPGTVKPEADYEEFQRLGKKLGLPCPQVFVELQSRAPDGSLHQQFKDRSRTFNRNYWNWLFKTFGSFISSGGGLSSDTTYAAGHLTNKATDASVINTTVAWVSPPQSVWFGGANANNGIVVGTGTAAESFEGYALGALIAHGTGSGQMSYVSMSPMVQPTYNAGTKVWTQTIPRVLNNNSGGTIVVGEVGLYATQSNGSTTHMIMRDLLGATVSVLNAGQLTVTYTFTLTFPA